MTLERFLRWEAGETRRIRFELIDKRSLTDEDPRSHARKIPEGYCRLLHQLMLETQLGKTCHDYEAERRMLYAGRVLDEFVEEITSFTSEGPGAGWRSKVLNPIFQRQVLGISDCYSWAVNRAVIAAGYCEKDPKDLSIEEDDEEFSDDTDDYLEDVEYSSEEIIARRRQLRPRPTILHATRTYLEFDPLSDPAGTEEMCRRNLLYVREMRWHLGIIAPTTPHKSSHVGFFQLTVKNQEFLQDCLATSGI